MRLRTVQIQGFRGPTYTTLPDDGEIIEFNRDVNHGDWKTALVRPGKWPTIKQGTKVKVVGWMQNMYGVYIRVEHGGSNYDVEDYKVKGLRR